MQPLEYDESQSSIENLFFDFIDRCKFLFFPEQWNQVFFELSKNDLFALLLVFRKGQVNMTEISDYLNVPLNTVTGVVNRLETKQLVLRERSREDRRVVTINLTGLGRKFISDEIGQIAQYYFKIMETLTRDQKSLLFEIINQIFQILSEDIKKPMEGDGPSRKIRKIVIE